jgi:hypothetical protein
MSSININLDNIKLACGSHSRREHGVCLMEAVAWFAGEEHSDHPKCVDTVLAAYGRALNDLLSRKERQILKPLIPKLVGTAGSHALMQRRAYLIIDRYVRSSVPAFLRELPNKPRLDLAAKFEALSPIVNASSNAAAHDVVRDVLTNIIKDLPAHTNARAYAYTDAYFYAYPCVYACICACASPDAVYVSADATNYVHAAANDAANAAADAVAWKKLRENTLARAVATFEKAIELTEDSTLTQD